MLISFFAFAHPHSCNSYMAAAPDGTEPQRKRARRDASNPLAYFDVAIGGEPAGKVVFELFKDVVPKAC